MKKSILFFLWGIIALSFAFPISAQQNVPNPPQNLHSMFKEQSDGTFDVQLTWNISPVNVAPFPDGFNIYKTTILNGIVSNTLEKQVPAQKGIIQYSFVVKNLTPGTYEFYVTSYLGLAESKPSNTVRLVLTNQEPFITIVSQPPAYAYVGKKYVYKVQAHSNINCPIDVFALEGHPPKGMTISSDGLLEWIPEQTGVYMVTIKVGSSCDNLKPTFQTFKIIVLTDHNDKHPYVRIISQPPTSAVVGEQISYQVIAESNIRCPINYKLVSYELLDNMNEPKIDSETGLFTWTPNKVGQFYIVIIAHLSCDTNVFDHQKFVINVNESNHEHKNCAHVVGTAKFEDDDTPVPFGSVNAWKLDAKDMQTNTVFKTYIKHGSFEFYLPNGTYVFEFNGEQFEHKFFINATRFAEAARIKLECNDDQQNEYPVEVFLKRKTQPLVFNVSGYVKSSKDQTPIPAVVEFIPVEFLFHPDRKLNYGTITNFITKTDSEGNFQILLPNSFTFIAHAIPTKNNQHFRDQYYYLSNSPFLADIIELDGDRNDINFLLDPIEQVENSFTGITIDKDRNPIQSRVIAIMVRPKPGTQTPQPHYSRLVETNENGQFTFTNLPPGEYVLLSIPKDNQYAPGYYKMNDFATLKWKDATIIAVDDVMIQIIYEIKHRNRSGWKGLVCFEGQVIDITKNIKVGDRPECNDIYVDEALVCAIDEYGELIDYCITDANGKFTLESLPSSTFKVVVSKVGYKEYETVVNADYESNYYFNNTIYIMQEVSGVTEENKFTIRQTEHNLIIAFENNIVLNQIVIFDVFGNSYNAKFVAENNLVTVDISNLPSGIYFLQLNNGKQFLSSKFLVVR
ncbi:MAG: T9SS type A sorting domain-containing protein [Candidatus Kapaibacteriota bacterium]